VLNDFAIRGSASKPDLPVAEHAVIANR
jgi:hypothetical protein